MRKGERERERGGGRGTMEPNKSSKIGTFLSRIFISLFYPLIPPVLDADFSIRMVKYLEAVRG